LPVLPRPLEPQSAAVLGVTGDRSVDVPVVLAQSTGGAARKLHMAPVETAAANAPPPSGPSIFGPGLPAVNAPDANANFFRTRPSATVAAPNTGCHTDASVHMMGQLGKCVTHLQSRLKSVTSDLHAAEENNQALNATNGLLKEERYLKAMADAQACVTGSSEHGNNRCFNATTGLGNVDTVGPTFSTSASSSTSSVKPQYHTPGYIAGNGHGGLGAATSASDAGNLQLPHKKMQNSDADAMRPAGPVSDKDSSGNFDFAAAPGHPAGTSAVDRSGARAVAVVPSTRGGMAPPSDARLHHAALPPDALPRDAASQVTGEDSEQHVHYTPLVVAEQYGPAPTRTSMAQLSLSGCKPSTGGYHSSFLHGCEDDGAARGQSGCTQQARAKPRAGATMQQALFTSAADRASRTHEYENAEELRWDNAGLRTGPPLVNSHPPYSAGDSGCYRPTQQPAGSEAHGTHPGDGGGNYALVHAPPSHTPPPNAHTLSLLPPLPVPPPRSTPPLVGQLTHHQPVWYCDVITEPSRGVAGRSLVTVDASWVEGVRSAPRSAALIKMMASTKAGLTKTLCTALNGMAANGNINVLFNIIIVTLKDYWVSIVALTLNDDSSLLECIECAELQVIELLKGACSESCERAQVCAYNAAKEPPAHVITAADKTRHLIKTVITNFSPAHDFANEMRFNKETGIRAGETIPSYINRVEALAASCLVDKRHVYSRLISALNEVKDTSGFNAVVHDKVIEKLMKCLSTGLPLSEFYKMVRTEADGNALMSGVLVDSPAARPMHARQPAAVPVPAFMAAAPMAPVVQPSPQPAAAAVTPPPPPATPNPATLQVLGPLEYGNDRSAGNGGGANKRGADGKRTDRAYLNLLGICAAFPPLNGKCPDLRADESFTPPRYTGKSGCVCCTELYGKTLVMYDPTKPAPTKESKTKYEHDPWACVWWVDMIKRRMGQYPELEKYLTPLPNGKPWDISELE